MIRLFSFLSSSSRTKLQLFEVDENGDDGDDDFPHRHLAKSNAKKNARTKTKVPLDSNGQNLSSSDEKK